MFACASVVQERLIMSKTEVDVLRICQSINIQAFRPLHTIERYIGSMHEFHKIHAAYAWWHTLHTLPAAHLQLNMLRSYWNRWRMGAREDNCAAWSVSDERKKTFVQIVNHWLHTRIQAKLSSCDEGSALTAHRCCLISDCSPITSYKTRWQIDFIMALTIRVIQLCLEYMLPTKKELPSSNSISTASRYMLPSQSTCRALAWSSLVMQKPVHNSAIMKCLIVRCPVSYEYDVWLHI